MVRPGQANAGTFFSSERWAELGASEAVVAALAALGIVRPSHIQVGGEAAHVALLGVGPLCCLFTRHCANPACLHRRPTAAAFLPVPTPQAAAFRAIAAPGGRHVVLADHAGSGKTLAYLLPLLQAGGGGRGGLGGGVAERLAVGGCWLGSACHCWWCCAQPRRRTMSPSPSSPAPAARR